MRKRELRKWETVWMDVKVMGNPQQCWTSIANQTTKERGSNLRLRGERPVYELQVNPPTLSSTRLFRGNDKQNHKSVTRKSIHFLHTSDTFVIRGMLSPWTRNTVSYEWCQPPCKFRFVSLVHCSSPLALSYNTVIYSRRAIISITFKFIFLSTAQSEEDLIISSCL